MEEFFRFVWEAAHDPASREVMAALGGLTALGGLVAGVFTVGKVLWKVSGCFAWAGRKVFRFGQAVRLATHFLRDVERAVAAASAKVAASAPEAEVFEVAATVTPAGGGLVGGTAPAPRPGKRGT